MAGVVTGDTVISRSQTITGATFEGTVTVTAPDVTLDRCWILGQQPDSTLLTCGMRTKVVNCDLVGSAQGQHRGIRVDAAGIIIVNSRVSNIWRDIDTQAICGWDGCYDLLVEHCELEASGEVVMFGGATMSKPENQPTHIVIRDSLLTRRIEWRSKSRGETCKNLFELKNAKDVTLDGCTLQYAWEDGQQGQAILLTVRQDPFPWSSVTDVRILNNQIRSTGAGVSILGHDDSTDQPCGYVERVTIAGNTFRDMNRAEWGGNGRILDINRGVDYLRFERNTVEGKGLNSFVYFSGGLTPYVSHGLVIADNDVPAGDYGIYGDGIPSQGVAVLDAYAPGYVWGSNHVTGREVNPYVVWPPRTW